MYVQISKNNLKTPLYKLDNELINIKGHNLYIKRDDLYPISGGGNKGRKLDYIINSKILKSFDSIVTCGSNHSNHVRASLIRANELGWKSHIIIHDIKPKDFSTGNLKITNLLADEITYVEMKDVAKEMDNAMSKFKQNGLNPLYIWGGGHCLEGSLAFHNAVFELKKQLENIKPNYIFLASGTGATQAGLVSGSKMCFEDCKVIGISISRDKKKGETEVFKSVKELEMYFGTSICKIEDIIFDNSYNGGGYNIPFKDLDSLIKEMAKSGIILDQIYTAKAFYGMIDYIKNNKLQPNSNIVFWHTGGLLNFLS